MRGYLSLSRAKQTFRAALQTVRQHPEWAILMLAYLMAWWTPFTWMRDQWVLSGAMMNAQPFVLLGTLLLLLLRPVTPVVPITTSGKPAPKYARYLPSLSLFILGCLLYVLAHFVRLASAGILGLVLILIGILYRVMGIHYLRANAKALLFLLLIVPFIPESGIALIEKISLRIYGMVSNPFLNRLGFPVQLTDTLVSVKGVAFTVNQPMRGMYGIFASFCFFLWLGLFRKWSFSRTLTWIGFGIGIAGLVHLIRYFVVMLLIPTNQPLAYTVCMVSSWIFSIAGILLTFALFKVLPVLQVDRVVAPWLSRLSMTNRRFSGAVDRKMDRASTVFSWIGPALQIVLFPIVWPLNKALQLFEKGFAALGSSNRNLEQWIRRRERERLRRREQKKQ